MARGLYDSLHESHRNGRSAAPGDKTAAWVAGGTRTVTTAGSGLTSENIHDTSGDKVLASHVACICYENLHESDDREGLVAAIPGAHTRIDGDGYNRVARSDRLAREPVRIR